MKRLKCMILLALGILLAGSPTRVLKAQEGVRSGWHVVRPGETLRGIAERYLGSEEAWETLAELNPQITNPDRIYPGRRIRVQVMDQAAPDTAQLTKVSRQVEEQLTPLAWNDASEENFLNARDGVRTFEDSSAELEFADATRLLVNEDSLVFLGRRGEVEQVRREEIEIVVGQADLEGSAAGQDYELVVGTSRMRPSADDGGRAQARARRPEKGGAQLMVYAGESVVESGGAQQSVETGMGTQMEDGAPPSPPEKLLPATELLRPASGISVPLTSPSFSWQRVEGAGGYVVEICQDAGCAQLAARFVDVPETTLIPEQLIAGSFFWRVTAVSPSGLDGYPSATSPFAVHSTVDTTAPTIAFSFEGVQVEHEGTLYVGVGSQLAVVTEDDDSGVESVWALFDGEQSPLEEIAGPWEVGVHEFEIRARDRSGNESSSGVHSFVYDPEPPVLDLRVERGPSRATYAGVRERFEPASAAGKRGRILRDLRWWERRADWRPVRRGVQEVAGGDQPILGVRTGRSEVRLLAAPGVEIGLGTRNGAIVESMDALSGTAALRFSVEFDAQDPGRKRWLTVETEDRLGNRTRVSWRLWRGPGGGAH